MTTRRNILRRPVPHGYWPTLWPMPLGADLAEFRCKRYQGGLLRYLRAGYDSVSGNLLPIEAPAIAAAGGRR